jgi:hypothetical protein
MLIGAHVSPAGGPANAIARGEERGCTAIQFFNQSPRAWRPRVYSEEEVAAYHEAIAGSEVDALLIHAVYLLNCASEDEEIRAKSLTALTHALDAGAALGAVGVVLHPGSALTKGGSVEMSVSRLVHPRLQTTGLMERTPLADGAAVSRSLSCSIQSSLYTLPLPVRRPVGNSIGSANANRNGLIALAFPLTSAAPSDPRSGSPVARNDRRHAFRSQSHRPAAHWRRTDRAFQLATCPPAWRQVHPSDRGHGP